MAIILYSGWGQKENAALSAKARQILKRKAASRGRSGRIAFVPVHEESALEDYRAFRQTLRWPQGSTLMRLPRANSKALVTYVNSLFNDFDGVFFGGGNTYEFLRALRTRGIAPAKLKSYLENGGVIMGLSAGGIVLTPHIATASIPSEDADTNSIGLKNRRGLGLVPFEFVPHFSGTAASIQEIEQYVSKSRRPVLACSDGSGILVRGSAAEVHGGATLFRNGKKRFLPNGSRLRLGRSRADL
jgi:dipeptidase E